MSQHMQEVMHIMTATVIYYEKGSLQAVAYLVENGYSDEEAESFLDTVERMRNAVRNN